jgi:hypothetical protein
MMVRVALVATTMVVATMTMVIAVATMTVVVVMTTTVGGKKAERGYTRE